ncbi:helix-turn-helix transcriptional regulator [Paraburkholderia sp. EG286B]|uniref:helix-turn-helix transcriptional regulator n=1 Tax=Paraburkholderia sp. EG286B TaxID=3237011 RepID=UPI0034D287F3
MPAPTSMKPLYLDLPAVAATVSLSETSVQKLVRENQFPKPRMLSGRRVAWLTREVEAWAEERPVSDLLPPPNTGHSNRRRRATSSQDTWQRSPRGDATTG